MSMSYVVSIRSLHTTKCSSSNLDVHTIDLAFSHFQFHIFYRSVNKTHIKYLFSILYLYIRWDKTCCMFLIPFDIVSCSRFLCCFCCCSGTSCEKCTRLINTTKSKLPYVTGKWNGKKQKPCLYWDWVCECVLLCMIYMMISCQYIGILFVFLSSLQDIDRIYSEARWKCGETLNMNIRKRRKKLITSQTKPTKSIVCVCMYVLLFRIRLYCMWNINVILAKSIKQLMQMGESQGKSENHFYHLIRFVFRSIWFVWFYSFCVSFSIFEAKNIETWWIFTCLPSSMKCSHRIHFGISQWFHCV